MITLDTSAIFAHLNRDDSHHRGTAMLLSQERGPLVMPVPILAELAYLVETRQGPAGFEPFLRDVDRGAYVLDCGEQDIPRVRDLITRYADLPLGFADAAVIACAERRGGRVLTYDRRHVPVVAREGTITVVG